MKVVARAMRRASGLALGTVAVFAVLLVGLSIASGAFTLAAPSAVRTDGGPAGHAASAHALAAVASAPHVAPVAPHASAMHPTAHPLVGLNISNYSLVAVNITPATATIAPGAWQVFTPVPICDNTTAVNFTCPGAFNITYAWGWGAPDLGALNATSGPSVNLSI